MFLYSCFSEFEVIIPKVFHQRDSEATVIHPSNFTSHSWPGHLSDLFINITTDNEEFHIKLLPNDKLLAPGFKIYHRHGFPSGNDSFDDITEDDDVITGSDIKDMSSCHFKGHVMSHDNVPAAFSLCNGVVSCFIFICY